MSVVCRMVMSSATGMTARCFCAARGRATTRREKRRAARTRLRAMCPPLSKRQNRNIRRKRPGTSRRLTSPHPHSLLRREVQLLAGFHVERGVPGVDVADGGDAVPGGGVAVGEDGAAEGLGALFAAPDLREREEEA